MNNSHASEDNSQPLVLETLGWETLPDKSRRLTIRCRTHLDYRTLPPEMIIHFEGTKTRVLKSGWDSDCHLAYYLKKIDLR